MIDYLASAHLREELSESLSHDIDTYCADTFNSNKYYSRVGMSSLGHACQRNIWSKFRWFAKEKHSGRILRLFQRGNLEEPRFVEYLKGIGCEVESEQRYLQDFNGHLGGAIDGIVKLPPKYNIKSPMLVEFKTKGSSLSQLHKKGVRLAEPTHYAQMSLYAHYLKLDYALYMCVNKSTDEIYIEIVKLGIIADELINKADYIINTKYPPPKVSNNPTNFLCKLCQFSDICHNNAPADINCRSCKHASAAPNGEWHCGNFNKTITPDLMKTGCDQYSSILNIT